MNVRIGYHCGLLNTASDSKKSLPGLFLLTLEVIPKSAVVKNAPAGTLLDALDILPIFPAFHQGARRSLHPLLCYHCRTNRAEAEDFTSRCHSSWKPTHLWDDRYALLMIQAASVRCTV